MPFAASSDSISLKFGLEYLRRENCRPFMEEVRADATLSPVIQYGDVQSGFGTCDLELLFLTQQASFITLLLDFMSFVV